MRILVVLITALAILASDAEAQGQGERPLLDGWILFEYPARFQYGVRSFVAKSSDRGDLGLGIQCFGDDVGVAVTHRSAVDYGPRVSLRYRFDGDEPGDWERWRLQSPSDVSLIDTTTRPDQVYEFVRSLRGSSKLEAAVAFSDSRRGQRDTFSLEGAVGATDRLPCVRRLLAGRPR